jgi:hypothetical protein
MAVWIAPDVAGQCLGSPHLATILTARGHGMLYSFGSGVNMYKTVTLPLIYRSVKLDIRCIRNANKPAALHRCLVFRNTSGLETHLNGRVRVHLRNLI